MIKHNPQKKLIYLLKASTASKGVMTGAKNSLLSKRAVWAQKHHTVHMGVLLIRTHSRKKDYKRVLKFIITSGKLASLAEFGLPMTSV